MRHARRQEPLPLFQGSDDARTKRWEGVPAQGVRAFPQRAVKFRRTSVCSAGRGPVVVAFKEVK